MTEFEIAKELLGYYGIEARLEDSTNAVQLWERPDSPHDLYEHPERRKRLPYKKLSEALSSGLEKLLTDLGLPVR